MKVLFKDPPPGVKTHIETHLGEVAEVVYMRKYQAEKFPSMWLVRFDDSTMCWLKPGCLEIVKDV